MSGSSYRPRLGELLVEWGVLTRPQLSQALAEQRHGSERIGETLLRLGLISRHQLAAALVEQYRRWMAGAVGLAIMTLEPSLGMAGSIHAELHVSAEVINTSMVDAQFTRAVLYQSAAQRDGAAVAVSCTASTRIRMAVEQVPEVAAAPQGGADAPRQVVDCKTAGETIRAPLTRLAAKGNAHQALNVLIEY